MRYSIIFNLRIYQRTGENEGGFLVVNVTLTLLLTKSLIFPKLL